jgi:hypothetical protein
MPSSTSLPQSGHAPTRLREAFQAYLDGERIDDAASLRSLLWNCTDTMPSDYCRALELPVGSTYAQGVRQFRPGMISARF